MEVDTPSVRPDRLCLTATLAATGMNVGEFWRPPADIHPKSPYRMNADDLPWTWIDKLWIRHRRFESYRPSHRLYSTNWPTRDGSVGLQGLVAGSPRVSRCIADLESASPARELVIATRLLLFGEAVGFAVALAETGATIAWLGKLGPLWVAILLLFAGAALVVAFQPGLYRPNRGTRWFLAINACTGLLLVSEGLGQRDPDP